MSLLSQHTREKRGSNNSQFDWRFVNIIKRSQGQRKDQIVAYSWNQLEEKVESTVGAIDASKNDLVLHQYDYIQPLLRQWNIPPVEGGWRQEQEQIRQAASNSAFSSDNPLADNGPEKSFVGTLDSFQEQDQQN